MGKYFQWNPAGYAELRQSQAVAAVVREAGEKVLANANAMSGLSYGIGMRVSGGVKGRAFCVIHPVGAKTAAKNRKHNILLKALGR